MKDTLIIAFNGGAYGTYLEWVLNTLISTDPVEEPFTALGNSHDSKLGHHLLDMEHFDHYKNSAEVYPTGRVHPKILASEDLATNLHHILDHVDKLVLLYPDRTHQLMCVCNFMTKIWNGHFYDGAMSYINQQDILANFPLDPDTDLRDIPLWIVREHMSFNLFESWQDQVEWYFPDTWQHPRAMCITTKQLFWDFESTINSVMHFWGRSPKKQLCDLQTSHEKMIAIQPHLGKDELCDAVLQSVLDQGPDWHWGELCIVSQAWIQYQLRLRGFEIRCHDLDDFPHHSQALRSLIYRA